MKTRATLVVLGLVLGACVAENADQAAAEPPADTSIAEPMTDAINDAKAVEDKAMEQKEEVDAALEDAESSAEDE